MRETAYSWVVAQKAKSSGKTAKRGAWVDRVLAPYWWLQKWLIRLALLAVIVVLGGVGWYSVTNPGQTPYMRAEARRLGAPVDHAWVPLTSVAPVMARSVVAAEDANFCLHWGFDMEAIRTALDEGSGRGASTLSQQVVKNVYLWQGRNWTRKALEAVITPIVEAMWSKRRIVEVYLNVAEFDEGVFGIDAAAQHYFSVTPADLSPVQAARLAAVLPSPKTRSAARPERGLALRATAIMDGAETIRRDGRASCFED
ncbi:MAG: monofunctional biosynthetic peptidoglycan transglycosylase [Rhodobacteraceae bacterium HLUCCO07]|nr:MAG: monofunctional biosynthetic peptidoglycan transglycosylase [Rhodobacteraceae bacterium HLUCCO07]